MTNTPEILSLLHALDTCLGHGQALQEALDDLGQRSMGADDLDLEHLTKEDRRLLDQFAYRYTRLQDDMGPRLIPASLRALERRDIQHGDARSPQQAGTDGLAAFRRRVDQAAYHTQ